MGKDRIVCKAIQQGSFNATITNKKYTIFHRNSIEIPRHGHSSTNICAIE